MDKIIKEFIKKYKWHIIVQIIFIIIHNYLITYPPKAIGQIIDLFYDLENTKIQIMKIIILIFVSCIGMLLTRLVWKRIEFNIDNNVANELRNKLFKKLLKSKIQDLEKIKNGELMSYFVSDIKTVARVISKVISVSARVLSYFAIVFYRLLSGAQLNFTLVVMLPIIIVLIITIILRNSIAKYYQNVQDSFTNLSEYVQESTDSIRTMKAFVGEEKQIKTFIDKNTKLRKNSLVLIRHQNLLDVLIGIGFGCSYAIVLLFGSKLILSNNLTIGSLIASISYLALLENPVYWTPWLLSRFKKCKISYNRLNKIFKLSDEVETIDIKKHGSLNGNIEIKDLTFKYTGSLENALENINLSVKKGETLGIIGMIGSGKTTLMNLLLKLYNVDDKKIFIDGKDINTIPAEQIREQICYITQDHFLFSTSIKENINLFKDVYKDEEIIESTKNSMIYDEVKNMSEGINTIIGEKGVDLSGGQKQRVVISRAFLNNSNIVIFDDTFSALDNRTEQHVLRNIKGLTKDKTCIIVSNRVSDIKHCDKIIVLHQGAIAELGTHTSLIKKEGLYYNFYKNQSRQSKMEQFNN